MKLLKVTVDRYKSITQASTITLDPKVTALVGKNEAGKTAVLEAVYRLNPLPSGHPTKFSELHDYPRRYRSRDKSKINSTYPSIMYFQLTADEVAEVETKFCAGILLKDHIKVTRGYGANSSIAWYDGQFDLVKLAGHRIAAAGLDVSRYLKDDLTATASALAADSDAAAAVGLSPTLTSAGLLAEIRQFLTPRLPKFQYFDEYNVLPGSVSINRLQGTEEDDLEPGERTALSLLRLAGVATEEFSETDYESRKASLEAAANQLTDVVFDYWTQNDQLSVELDIDFRPIPENPSVREPWLEIRVRNSRHRVTLNMSDRSKGFIWFFSFLAAFSEYGEETNRIILLDEPGLNLHAKAQRDLLRYMDERLAESAQVIYSTHSLFMIEPERLERCRTVEDIGDAGTIVSEDIWAAREDTVFPLLGALGVELGQTLVIAAKQLVVEGPADVVYLTVMSEHLRSLKRTHLDPDWTITPAGGIDKIPTFVALLGGSDLKITVLMDSAPGTGQKVMSMVDRGLLEQNRLIPLNAVTKTNEADIEDLFAVDWYIKLAEASKVGRITRSKLTGGRITKQIEVALGAAFSHYQPANHFQNNQAQFLPEIDDASLDRFEQLFQRVNSSAP